MNIEHTLATESAVDRPSDRLVSTTAPNVASAASAIDHAS
jgi:hypothetical protein